MTLLPDVERELLRVARKPLPSPFQAEVPPAPGSERRLAWEWPSSSGAAAVLAALVAVALGGIFLVVLHHRGAHLPTRHMQGPGVNGSFPGAPTTQPGDWEGAVHLCPVAPRNRYLPARSGCVSVVRADVDGDGRPDLVLVYGRLSHDGTGGRYVPTAFVLKVVRASGGVVQTLLPAPEADPTVLEIGHASGQPGVALFILIGRISSGASALVYSFHGGRLTDAGPTLGFGGDSGAKAGFTCHAGSPRTLVQHTFLLARGGESGWWQRIDVTYAWRDGLLKQVERRTSMRHGLPPSSGTGLGLGCGTLTRMGLLQYPAESRVSRNRTHVLPTLQHHTHAVSKCVAADLHVSLGPEVVPQTGEDADMFVLRDVSGRRCVVLGYPKVTLSYPGGSLPFVYRDGGGAYVTISRPRTVMLGPGARAYVLVAKYRCDGRVAHTATKITMAMPASPRTLSLGLDGPGASQLNYCQRYPGDQPIDPGNRVAVSPIGAAEWALR
jgi:hypothetical protein